MNQPRNTAVTEAIEKLGLEACKAELLAFDESLPIEVRADHYIRAQDLRTEQVAMLEPYPLSNVLKQGPNVSHRNPVTAAERVIGAVVILGIFGFCWAVFQLGKIAWRLL